MPRVLLAFVLALVLVPGPDAQSGSDRVVLVTLDGARTEEIFGGLDLAVLKSTLSDKQTPEAQPAYKRFWAGTPEARREKLMPFFWGTLMRDHGSVAGNRAVGSEVRLTNRHWFSYPGYAEMLLGTTHDDVITSNDPVQNPYPTVLEFLRTKTGADRTGVALFASWSVFNAIGESREGALTINAGFERSDADDPESRQLSDLQTQTPTPWDSVRHDVYTFRLAMAHLARHKPRVLYLALGETDDWAHDGRYDRVLEAYARSDAYLNELWTWLQSQPDYRNRTSLLITTDHGRGHTTKDWKSHGDEHPGSEATWVALISPSLSRRGEWRDHAPITTSQVAATLISWMGFDWREFNPNAAPPIR
jgi:hypothetical protein